MGSGAAHTPGGGIVLGDRSAMRCGLGKVFVGKNELPQPFVPLIFTNFFLADWPLDRQTLIIVTVLSRCFFRHLPVSPPPALASTRGGAGRAALPPAQSLASVPSASPAARAPGGMAPGGVVDFLLVFLK